MIAPRTYRSRLVVYIGALLLFLVTSLVLSYRSSSDLVLKEAESSVTRLAQQIESQIKVETRDLAERARMMRDNTGFTSYLYIAISLGTDPGALRELYQRQFGWMQIDRSVVVSRTGKTLIGGEHADLAASIVLRQLPASEHESLFFREGRGGLEMVATAPLSYRSQPLGVIAVTRAIDAHWLEFTRQISGGHLVLANRGRIALSTFGANRTGQTFEPADDQVMIDGEPYLVRRVSAGDDPQLPQLWLAQSQQELTAHLRVQRDRMLALAILGCVGGLFAGFMILKNFSAPLGNLMRMMQEVGAGRIPEFRQGPARDEIGYLSNRFAEMVTSLREQQEEVRRAHAQLEREAVTDALTGFYNRRYLYDLYPRIWSEAMRHGKPLSLIIVDLDLFKRINDRYGHVAGDQVLLHFARVLSEGRRVSDFLFRLGGEEFLILAPGDIEGAQVLAEKIRSQLEREPCQESGRLIPVTASFGIAEAEASDGVGGLGKALSRADQALYSAKQSGRNRVAVWYQHRQSA